MGASRLPWWAIFSGARRDAAAARFAGAPVAEAPPFDQLVKAYCAKEASFAEAERAYSVVHGAIQRRCYSERCEAGVIVTADGRLHAIAPPDASEELMGLFFHAQAAESNICASVPDGDRDRCLGLLFEILASAIRANDATGGHIKTDTVRVLGKQLEEAKQTISEAANRRAQLYYSAGVVLGVALIAVIGLIVNWAIPRLTPHLLVGADAQQVPELFMACLNAGGAGALLSVLMRMSSNTLRIRTTSGRGLLFLVGGMRPIIGGICGVATYTLYQAKFLPIAAPTAPDNTTAVFFLVGALAFLSGFSERLAQDSFVRTGRAALSGQGAKK